MAGIHPGPISGKTNVEKSSLVTNFVIQGVQNSRFLWCNVCEISIVYNN